MNNFPIAIVKCEIISCHGNLLQFADNHLQGSKLQEEQRELVFFEQKYSQKVYNMPGFDTSVIPSRVKRRMSTLSQMIVACGMKCLDEIAIENKQDIGVVVGTGWGELTTTQDLLFAVIEDEPMVSPTQFHNSVHNTAAGYLGIISEITGPTLTISQENQTFSTTLETSFALLQNNMASGVLVVVGDIHFNFSVLDSNIQNYPKVFAAGCSALFLQKEVGVNHNILGYLQHIKTAKYQSREILYQEMIAAITEAQNQFPPDIIWFSGANSEQEVLDIIKQGNFCSTIFSYTLDPPTYPTEDGEGFIQLTSMIENNTLSKLTKWFVFDSQSIKQIMYCEHHIRNIYFIKLSTNNDLRFFRVYQ